MKLKNRIAIITSEFPPEPGGIGNHALNLAKHLTLRGFQVAVATEYRVPNSEKEKVFDEAQIFSIKRIAIKKFRVLMYINRISTIFKCVSQADVVIASGKFSLWIVALSTFFYKRKSIAIMHGTEVNFKSKYLRKSINFSLKKFQKVIAVSKYTKSLVKSLNLKHIEVISNGFDLDLINEKNHGKLKGEPSLITVGSVTDRKGQLNVIKMLPSLLKVYPNIHYHIVGSPIDKELLIKAAKKLNVENHISFYGIVSEEKKNALLIESDIFVMLSRNTEAGDVEGFGIALIEANAFGIPTIGSKNCGIEDAIDDSKSGVLIDNKSDEEFKNALEMILNKYPYFHENSKLWASKFTWDIIVEKYIKVINN